MPTIVYLREVDLPAEPETVFWDLLEPDHVVEYDSHFRSWTPREWPPVVGTRVDFEAKVFGLWSKGTSEFVAFGAPCHLELRLVSPATPLKSRLVWTLEATPTGTAFEYQFEIDTPPGLGWLGKMLLAQFTSRLDVELPALAQRYA